MDSLLAICLLFAPTSTGNMWLTCAILALYAEKPNEEHGENILKYMTYKLWTH